MPILIKKENKAVLIERIVEATSVGARLRSETIKGIELKRKY